MVGIHIGNATNCYIGISFPHMRIKRFIHIGRHIIVAINKTNIGTMSSHNACIARIGKTPVLLMHNHNALIARAPFITQYRA